MKPLIAQEKYDKDFAPLAGFYTYHVQNKKLPISLDELQDFGVHLEAVNIEDVARVDEKTLPLNTIVFSSSKKNNNAKNLTWSTIRCLVSHPENIEEIENDGIRCYKLKCSSKKGDKIVPTMKGVVACDVWPDFTKKLQKIIEERAQSK